MNADFAFDTVVAVVMVLLEEEEEGGDPEDPRSAHERCSPNAAVDKMASVTCRHHER